MSEEKEVTEDTIRKKETEEVYVVTCLGGELHDGIDEFYDYSEALEFAKKESEVSNEVYTVYRKVAKIAPEIYLEVEEY